MVILVNNIEENIEVLETLLMELRLKYHFTFDKRVIKITPENLCNLLFNYTELIKKGVLNQ